MNNSIQTTTTNVSPKYNNTLLQETIQLQLHRIEETLEEIKNILKKKDNILTGNSL